jgi:nicotinamidase-related amidase
MRLNYLAVQNALIEGCLAREVPVVRVLHVNPGEVAGDPFSLRSGLVRPLDGLVDFKAAATFEKRRHSALVGSGLDVWLTERGIGRLIVSGIRTEQCCETTTRHASDLGWQVIFVPEATLTFAMTLANGAPFPPAAIRERTAAVLADRFAEIRSVQSTLALLEADALAAA